MKISENVDRIEMLEAYVELLTRKIADGVNERDGVWILAGAIYPDHMMYEALRCGFPEEEIRAYSVGYPYRLSSHPKTDIEIDIKYYVEKAGEKRAEREKTRAKRTCLYVACSCREKSVRQVALYTT